MNGVSTQSWGGDYERLVGLVKNCFKKLFGTKPLDKVEFARCLYQIADILNGRPLTYVSSDEQRTSLKPNHFLRVNPEYAESGLSVTPPTVMGELLLQGWIGIRAQLNVFWSTFRNQYFSYLREKHVTEHRRVRGTVPYKPQIGDVVLVQEPNAKRGLRHLGRIEPLDSRGAPAQVYM